MWADMTTDGLDALLVAMKRIEEIPDDVQDKMINAMADVRMEAIAKSAASMLSQNPGTYYTGDLAENVSKSKPSHSKNGVSIEIRWLGKQHGNRRGEIAYINEYGKKSQKARPFIKQATIKSDAPSMEAAGKIYAGWLEANG